MCNNVLYISLRVLPEYMFYYVISTSKILYNHKNLNHCMEFYVKMFCTPF